MLIEIHMIQNHSPANLNRDDLGAPKTCWFGGVLRSRISSQCIKRSIRMSDEFHKLLGGIRTRQLAKLIVDEAAEKKDGAKRVEKILELCGLKPKKGRGEESGEEGAPASEKSKMLVYTTRGAIKEMAALFQSAGGKSDAALAQAFGKLIEERTAVPDMALCGRMLETGVLKNTTVDAALQVAHAISTHEARPEVDYYVAADDERGEDAGAGYVDEAMFASACFYKYFSIHWETLVKNLSGFPGNKEPLAAHTIGAFLRGAALVTPSGKQNSFAAHNPPEGILVEMRKKKTPISYANAFAKPVETGERDIVSQSVAQLAQYVHDLDAGFGKSDKRFWFSPNLRHDLSAQEDKREIALAENNFKSLEELTSAVIAGIGHDWKSVQNVAVNPEAAS
jgi:CRISPR system Cascade subunit CasC